MADLKKTFDEVKEAASGFSGGNIMTSLQKDVGDALRIDDIDKGGRRRTMTRRRRRISTRLRRRTPTRRRTDAPVSASDSVVMRQRRRRPTAETFAETETHAGRLATAGDHPGNRAAAGAQDTATPDVLKDAKSVMSAEDIEASRSAADGSSDRAALAA